MAELYTRIRSTCTFCLSLVYFCSLFLKSELINHLCLAFMIVVILLSFTAISGVSSIIGYTSFGMSIWLFFLYHAPLSVWEKALMGNLYLVVLFTMVPVLSIPIQHGGYYPGLQSFFRRYVHTNKRYYMMVSFMSAFVGILVNLAVVPLVYQIVQASEISRNKKLMSSAISRGFATCVIWAPTTATVALVMKLTGANWVQFLPVGVLCSVICGVVGYSMTMFQERGTGVLENCEEEDFKDKTNIHKVIELAAFSVILIVSIVLLTRWTGIQTVIMVSMAALVFPFIWMGLIGRISIMLKEFKEEYYKERLPKLSNEIILFVGAGMFASSITYSQLGNYIPVILSHFVGDSALMLGVVVVFSVIALSSIGVHPIIPITIIGGTVQASTFGVSPTYIAAILTISWSMGITLSPTSAIMITLSGLTSQSQIQVGLRWNGLYVLITSIILIFSITIFRMVGLL